MINRNITANQPDVKIRCVNNGLWFYENKFEKGSDLWLKISRRLFHSLGSFNNKIILEKGIIK